MINFKKTCMILALVTALGAGFGCAKKQTGAESGTVTDGSASANAAAIERATQVITQGIVYFEFDKFDVQPQYNEMLQQKAELLKTYPSIHIRVEGNCDARGTEEYNLALGGRRARAAYDYMVRLGVNPAQLETISYGKERPAVQGDGPEAWSKNRRDDFQILSR